MAGREITEATQANRRLAEVFRKGVVSAVDDSGAPILYTISDGSQAKVMPSTQAGLVAGDVVVWVDQSDPFALGKFAGT